MRIILAIACLTALSACNGTGAPATQASTAVSVIADGQLFCAVKDSTVALATVSGSTVAPVLAKGASSAYVKAACAVVNGVAVSPPVTPGASATLTIPALSIPLKA